MEKESNVLNVSTPGKQNRKENHMFVVLGVRGILNLQGVQNEKVLSFSFNGYFLFKFG